MPTHNMATFRAHNVDYDSSDSEVDDTKELQIEEALKLYQTALKFHSEGPTSFYEAQEAYRELFESEIFSYAESLTEYQRWMTLPEYDELLQQTFDPVTQTILVAGDNAPNTLPQVLHLALKNRAQFMLDVIAHRVKESVRSDGNYEEPTAKDLQEATAAMHLYAAALDKDESDLDIWRRTSRISMWAGSYRIARFCLEAVLDGEQEGLEGLFDMPGIDEMLASHELQHLTLQLEDDLSQLIGPMKSSTRRQLSAAMKKLINPYPVLKPRLFGDSIISKEGNQGRLPDRDTIKIRKRDWMGIGESILEHLAALKEDVYGSVTSSVHFDIPKPDDSKMSEVAGVGAIKSGTQRTNTVGLNSIERISSNQPELVRVGTEATIESISSDQPEVKIEGEAGAESIAAKQSSDKDGTADANNTRKRSTESAGLPEHAEGGRSRSKRIRARWATNGERIDVAQAEASKELVVNEQQLEALKSADTMAHETIQPILERLDIHSLVAPALLEDMVLKPDSETVPDQVAQSLAVKDLFTALKSCEARIMESLQTDSFTDHTMAIASRQAGLNVFLGHDMTSVSEDLIKLKSVTDVGLDAWVNDVNSSWLPLKEIAHKWLVGLFQPPEPITIEDTPWSHYTHSSWSDQMKDVVRQISNETELFTYNTLHALMRTIEAQYLHNVANTGQFKPTSDELATFYLIEGIFEILVDGFARTTAETLTSNQHLRKQAQVRLSSWSQLAMGAVRLAPAENAEGKMNDLQIRHIWTQATFISLHEDTSQEYNLACVRDLHDMMRTLDGRVIKLPNNDTIKEISQGSVEAKLRRLNMKDLFLRVFADDKDDDDSAINIIQTVDPLLEVVDHQMQANNNELSTSADQDFAEVSQEIATFVLNSNVSLRLALWRRLRDAYQSLLLRPMVVFCDLKSIDTIINELQSENYKQTNPMIRQSSLLRSLRLADDLILRILAMRTETTELLGCIDAEQLKRSMRSLASLSSILHAFRMVDDQVTVGQCQTPGPSNRSHALYTNVASRMNEMIMRTWTLQYILLKDAIDQFPESFSNPREDRLNYLRAVHHAAGPRSVCNVAKKVFLKLERDELLELSDHPDANWETCQVLFDLYGLKSTQHLIDLADHGCDDPEPLTRKEALKLLGFMLAQADKISMKDLLKAELKNALETVHEALGRPRAAESNLMNKRLVGSYIKGPVNPLNLYASLKGALSLTTKAISPADMPIASKGWYKLLGMVSLLKFRSVKRSAGMDVEDLDAAMNFFLLDLEYSSNQWETWYRLGQVYDLQVEEAISWNAEKLTGSTNEVLTIQRQAINCYAMAVSCCIRSSVEENIPTMSSIIGELYADFGTRLYSSSRDPFCMKAFIVKESEEKIYNRVDGPGNSRMYKAPSFVTLKLFSAWRLAASLLREAIKRCPDKWLYHYTLGKCLWKMHTASDRVLGKHQRSQMVEVIEAFTEAVKVCPKTRSSKDEPVLEPHYKIISIAHKLVNRGLDFSRGCEIVQVSSHATKIAMPSDGDGWEEYVLKILKTLRSADKASWHHRMTARAAQINYVGSGKDMFGALAAKHELMQQMFTKTMTLQVWRPACERPGRHFVYKTRYVRFFVELLDRTKDRSNYELLVRKLRRKISEYWEHKELWQDVCLKYLKILRASTGIPLNYDEIVFKGIMHDEFLLRADALEKWARSAQNNNILDVLREAAELKKLNSNYMKSIVIDELMTDSYAQLYAHVAGDLPVASSPVKEDPKVEIAAANGGESVLTDDKTAEPTSKGRIKGVGRRELLKRAELAGFVSHSSSALTPSERRQAAKDKDKDSQASESLSLRASVSVVVPALRELQSIEVDLDTGSDSELSEMSNEEIEEIGDALPSSIKHALGVGRKPSMPDATTASEDVVVVVHDNQDGHAEDVEMDDKHDDENEENADDADDEGIDEDDQEEEQQEEEQVDSEQQDEGEDEDEQVDVEHQDVDEDDDEEEEEADRGEDEEMDQGQDVAVDDVNIEEDDHDPSSMDLDESALVEEQMRMESGA